MQQAEQLLEFALISMCQVYQLRIASSQEDVLVKISMTP
jgi:hypothetical protein